MLTKSLHTITAATNVARFILASADSREFHTATGAWLLAARALAVLGHDVPVASAEFSDATVAKIRENCSKLLGAPVSRVAADRAAQASQFAVAGARQD